MLLRPHVHLELSLGINFVFNYIKDTKENVVHLRYIGLNMTKKRVAVSAPLHI